LLFIKVLFKSTSTARLPDSIYKYKSKNGKTETLQLTLMCKRIKPKLSDFPFQIAQLGSNCNFSNLFLDRSLYRNQYVRYHILNQAQRSSVYYPDGFAFRGQRDYPINHNNQTAIPLNKTTVQMLILRIND